MNLNIEQLKKKIIYRSNYRGTKEMDKILSSFVNEYINDFCDSELLLLSKFLEIDDDELYKFYNGLNTNYKFDDSKIIELFKKFKYKNTYK